MEKTEQKLWIVEEIETISFDENGKEDGTWKGYAVTCSKHPSEYNFHCRDKTNADMLCDFLNEHLKPVWMDLNELEVLIYELSDAEIGLYELKEAIFNKEQKTIRETDFDKLYGKNNKDVRKEHLDTIMAADYQAKKDLEFSIDYLKRRISYLKHLIHTKNILMESKRL